MTKEENNTNMNGLAIAVHTAFENYAKDCGMPKIHGEFTDRTGSNKLMMYFDADFVTGDILTDISPSKYGMELFAIGATTEKPGVRLQYWYKEETCNFCGELAGIVRIDGLPMCLDCAEIKHIHG